jgi:bifunctional non-homologous end joining protein LigD
LAGRRIVFRAHDYVEFTENGKRYTVPLEHDALQKSERGDWEREVESIRKMSWSTLKKKGIEYVPEMTVEEKRLSKMTGPEKIMDRIIGKEYFSKKFNPMRPVDTTEIPEGDQWLAERKWDGTRMRVDVHDDKVELVNRRQNDKTSQFPELQHIAKDVRGNISLDGEVIVPWGRTGESFSLLSQREHTQDEGKVLALSEEHPARFIAFDVLSKGGRDTTSLPFRQRKELLQGAIRQDQHIREVVTTPRKEGFVRRMRGIGAEGVVFKDKESLYREGKRSKEWRKLKFKKEADVEVIGYEPGVGKREGLIGALQTRKGKVGTGFTDEENVRLKKLLDAGKHPIVRIEYRGKGSQGAYREPVYVGLRSDIKRSEVN